MAICIANYKKKPISTLEEIKGLKIVFKYFYNLLEVRKIAISNTFLS